MGATVPQGGASTFGTVAARVILFFATPQRIGRRRRKGEERRRQLVKVADVAAEVLLIPLLVLSFPLHVVVCVMLQAASLIGMMSIQVAGETLPRVFLVPLGAS